MVQLLSEFLLLIANAATPRDDCRAGDFKSVVAFVVIVIKQEPRMVAICKRYGGSECWSVHGCFLLRVEARLMECPNGPFVRSTRTKYLNSQYQRPERTRPSLFGEGLGYIWFLC